MGCCATSSVKRQAVRSPSMLVGGARRCGLLTPNVWPQKMRPAWNQEGNPSPVRHSPRCALFRHFKPQASNLTLAQPLTGATLRGADAAAGSGSGLRHQLLWSASTSSGGGPCPLGRGAARQGSGLQHRGRRAVLTAAEGNTALCADWRARDSLWTGALDKQGRGLPDRSAAHPAALPDCRAASRS